MTDLLDEAADGLVRELPEPQRIALARRMPGSATVGQREVGMAVLAVLRRLCEQRRVLIVLDDVSWVDSPTVEAVRFALRRMRRADPGAGHVAARSGRFGGVAGDPGRRTAAGAVERGRHRAAAGLT